MHCVKGIIVQHLTREIRAFSTMKEPSVLATDGYSTFTMKRMSICFDTTAASGSLSIHATDTDETTSCINHEFLIRQFFQFKILLILIKKGCSVAYHKFATAGTVERSFSNMASFVQLARQTPQP